MKLRNLFLAAIVALGMMACNNEEVPAVLDGAKSTVSVKVMPSSNGAGVRATGEVVTNATGNPEESYIKTLEVYLFYGNNLEGYKSATPETGNNTVTEVIGIETTTGPKTIVVVANGNIGTVADKPALLAKTKELPVTIANGLTMTGESAEIIVAPGQNYYGYSDAQLTGKEPGAKHSVGAPLKITRVNARVAIVDAKLDETLPPAQAAIFDALTNVEVAIFNVPKSTKLFGESLAMNANYLFGENWPSSLGSFVNVPANADAANFKNAVTFPIVNTAAPYYYVNENTATDKKEQMLIVLRGKPTKGGDPVKAEGLYTDAAGYTYYPVWVNKAGYTYDAGHNADSKILRNTQYNISLLIKGIGNPTIDPVQDAFLDVIVEVEPWNVVNQNVTWN